MMRVAGIEKLESGIAALPAFPRDELQARFQFLTGDAVSCEFDDSQLRAIVAYETMQQARRLYDGVSPQSSASTERER